MDEYKNTIDIYNKVASAYEEKFMQLDLYNDTYDAFCQAIIMKNANVLEIACGPGNITKYLINKRTDLKIDAIDMAEKMVELAKKNNPAANVMLMDCRQINTLTTSYDGIICGFCMPYLSKQDCNNLIADCAGLLNKNGILYLSTIEGEYNQSGYQEGSTGDKLYVYYHEENYLRELLLAHTFEIISVIKKAYPASNPDSTHMIFIAKRKF